MLYFNIFVMSLENSVKYGFLNSQSFFQTCGTVFISLLRSLCFLKNVYYFIFKKVPQIFMPRIRSDCLTMGENLTKYNIFVMIFLSLLFF